MTKPWLMLCHAKSLISFTLVYGCCVMCYTLNLKIYKWYREPIFSFSVLFLLLCISCFSPPTTTITNTPWIHTRAHKHKTIVAQQSSPNTNKSLESHPSQWEEKTCVTNIPAQSRSLLVDIIRNFVASRLSKKVK